MTWTTEAMRVSYRQYYLSESGLRTDTDLLQTIVESNCVAAAGKGGVYVRTGTHSGHLKINVDLLDAEPALDLDRWDAAVDLSHRSTAPAWHLTQWEGVVVGDAGNLAHRGPGWYRVRIRVRGRDAGKSQDTVLDDPVEEHWISIWPAAPAAELLHKLDDEFGRANWTPGRTPLPAYDHGHVHRSP